VPAKRAVIYLRISSLDHNPQTLHDLQQFASQRGCEVVEAYSDRSSGTKAKRPAWDSLLADARRRKFDVVIAQSLTDVASSVKQCVEVLHQLSQLGIGFVASREEIDTTDTTMGQAMAVIVGGLAEVTRNVRIANVKEGMRRAALGGVKIGRTPLSVDRAGLIQARLAGASLTDCSKRFCVSRAYVCRVMKLVGGQPEKLPPYTGEPLSLGVSA
jgi:DNA invertase Pin-like site-specific DNA recombinase